MPASRPVLVRTYCRQCKNHVSNDRLGDDGKTLRRVCTEALPRKHAVTEHQHPTAKVVLHGVQVQKARAQLPTVS